MDVGRLDSMGKRLEQLQFQAPNLGILVWNRKQKNTTHYKIKRCVCVYIHVCMHACIYV